VRRTEGAPDLLDTEPTRVFLEGEVSMSRKRRSFTPEYKEEMARMIVEMSRPIPSVARDGPYTKERRKPTDRSLREKTGRKPGTQPGALGSTPEQVADPDDRVVCAPSSCRGCAADLADAPVEVVNTRQVFDPPPPPRPRVTEYQIQARRCRRCGTLSEGQAPAGANARAQYGPDTHAHAANLVCSNLMG
jgi:transposase-like protein